MLLNTFRTVSVSVDPFERFVHFFPDSPIPFERCTPLQILSYILCDALLFLRFSNFSSGSLLLQTLSQSPNPFRTARFSVSGSPIHAFRAVRSSFSSSVIPFERVLLDSPLPFERFAPLSDSLWYLSSSSLLFLIFSSLFRTVRSSALERFALLFSESLVPVSSPFRTVTPLFLRLFIPFERFFHLRPSFSVCPRFVPCFSL